MTSVLVGGSQSGTGGFISIKQRHYLPDSISVVVSQRILEDIGKNNNRQRNACWCDWLVREDDWGGDTTHLHTNYIACVPEGFDAKYFCKSLNNQEINLGYKSSSGYRMYATTENCRKPYEIHTEKCLFLPGTRVRLHRGGKYMHRVGIDSKMALYLREK